MYSTKNVDQNVVQYVHPSLHTVTEASRSRNCLVARSIKSVRFIYDIMNDVRKNI